MHTASIPYLLGKSTCLCRPSRVACASGATTIAVRLIVPLSSARAGDPRCDAGHDRRLFLLVARCGDSPCSLPPCGLPPWQTFVKLFAPLQRRAAHRRPRPDAVTTMASSGTRGTVWSLEGGSAADAGGGTRGVGGERRGVCRVAVRREYINESPLL